MGPEPGPMDFLAPMSVGPVPVQVVGNWAEDPRILLPCGVSPEEYLRRRLREVVLHEVDEGMMFAGRRFFGPHAPPAWLHTGPASVHNPPPPDGAKEKKP